VGFRPWLGLLLLGAVKAVSLLVPFFKYDVLTAMASIATPVYAAMTMTLVAQPAPALRRSGWIAAAIGIGFIALEFYFARRGRLYGEDEVRPVYARNLAERLSLQAEASAAREAQARLMPQALPRMAPLAIAARCLPAHEVGGDFYDLFALDPERLGILLAEGGGRGLASALSIAYAKGFLMPRLRDDSHRDTSPTELLRSLQVHLLRVVEDGEGMGVAFAVIDTSDGMLRYARTGSYPRIMIGRGGQLGKLLAPEEREVKFSTGRAENEITVREATFQLEAGDQVIMLTDGIAKSIAPDGQSPEVAFWKQLSAHPAHSTDDLDAALKQTVDVSLKRARSLGLEDDLTAVVVRLDGPTAGR
jgi:sigma-B regulation protein RsbU (phosphoserine phosphatase)